MEPPRAWIAVSILLAMACSIEPAEREESRQNPSSNVVDLELLLSQLSKPDVPHNMLYEQLVQQTQLPVMTNESSSVPDKANGTRVLRLAVFSDDALLTHLSDLYPEDPFTAAEKYITTGVSAIEELIQQAVSEGVEFKIKLVQVGVWAEKGAMPFNTNGLSSSNLLSFCEWASERKPERGDPGHWHHAMLLTGKELFETTKESLGVTFVGGLCHPRTSCSVVEANSFKAVQVAAHELAHSMGVQHDGEGPAAHCPSEGFIMGQSLSEKTFDWSNCSRDAISAYLRNNSCLERKEDGRGFRGLDHTQGGLPGQRYSADEQCKLALGKGYRATPSKRNICEYLMCTNGVTTRGVHPALPGTSCGNNRVCIAGKCGKGGGGSRPPNNPNRPPTWPPSNPNRPPSNPYRPPSNPNRPPSNPYRPPSNPYRPPSNPYRPPSNPNRPPSNPYRPPNNPYRPPNNSNRPPNRPNRPANKPTPFSSVEGADKGIKNNKFPLATIPNELENIPVPYRCHFMPPFLHRYIGCDKGNRNPASYDTTEQFLEHLDTPAEVYEYTDVTEDSHRPFVPIEQLQYSPISEGLREPPEGTQGLSFYEEIKNSSIAEGGLNSLINGELQQNLTFVEETENSTFAGQVQELLSTIQDIQETSTITYEFHGIQNSTQQGHPSSTTVQQVQETQTSPTVQDITESPVTAHLVPENLVTPHHNTASPTATSETPTSTEQLAPTVNAEVIYSLTTDKVVNESTPTQGLENYLKNHTITEQISTVEPVILEQQPATTQSTNIEELISTEHPVIELTTTEQSEAVQSTTEHSATELTIAAQTATEELAEEQMNLEQITTEQPLPEQATKQSTTERPAAGQAISEQTTTEQSGSHQTTTEQVTTEQPVIGQSTPEQITTEKPVVETTPREQFTTALTTAEQTAIEQFSTEEISAEQIIYEQITTEQTTTEKHFITRQTTTRSITGEQIATEPSIKQENPAVEPTSATQTFSEQTFTDSVKDSEDEQTATGNGDGEQSNTILSVEDFNVAGSGLHFSVPSDFLYSFLAPALTGSLAKGASLHKRPLKDKHLLKEMIGRQPMFTRIANLREGHHQEPVVAATAPSHTRAIRIGPCSRTCGGGTRSVTQVCVKMDAPEVEVSEELCDGLPYSFSSYNQSCNTFPCSIPEWVVGPWSECSHWCGLGVQRRLVACGLPLVAGASPLVAGRFLTQGRCAGDQPIEVRLCKGLCVEEDCTLPENILHPACRHLLKDTPLERDHTHSDSSAETP